MTTPIQLPDPEPLFATADTLLPCIVQDHHDARVLMLGHMNRESYELTCSSGRVTFFSRSRGRLWTKGETSGNFLEVRSIRVDCDRDTVLVTAVPLGPVCHTGTPTCFGEPAPSDFIRQLERVIRQRRDQPDEKSYTSSLFAKGINKVAQKVGEEAVELVIEAKDNDQDRFLNEAADLLYHYLILLAAKGHTLDDVQQVLIGRHRPDR